MLKNLTPITSLATKSQVYPNQLLAFFTAYLDQIELVSLDCFDTLLWRNLDTPQDAFYTLQHKTHFKAAGLTPIQRMTLEDKARGYAYFKNQTSEVTLIDIYRQANNHFTDETIQALMQDELATELEHCYAFPVIVELMRLAKLYNKKIIIVSDTYYSEAQLRFILEKKLPQDAYQAIDKVYCSCEYNKSKSHGLFKTILQETHIPSYYILHIGDNPIADKIAAQNLKIHAIQLLHGDIHFEQLQNMRAWAASFVDQSIRYSQPLFNPFTGLIAQYDAQDNAAEKLIGYAAMGPIMYAFADFLRREIYQLQQLNKRVKVLFLMRDAYLPAQACEKLMGQKIGELIHISRFATNAAAFTDKQAIEYYLSEVVHSKQFADICRQLLLSSELSEALIQAAEKSHQPAATFIEMVMKENIITAILTASAAYRKRLFVYLKKALHLEANDTLVFVDLGYTATTQQKLAPLLQTEFGVDVIGRYLISLPTTNLASAKKGLLDNVHYDERLLTMLVRYIAIIEQICTSHGPSVINYDENGEPIFSDPSISSLQKVKTQAVQTECIKFIAEVEPFLHTTQITLTPSILRDMAAIELCRLMYLPTALEIHYFNTFQFDFNLGTSTVLDVFNVDKGVAELRKHGLFFMERNPKKMRTNYPAELRSASLELSCLLMSMERYKGKITAHDLSLRRETLPIILATHKQTAKDFVLALPTFDGYYSAFIPLGNGQFQVGIQFGKIYRWLEIESVALIPTHAIYSTMNSELTRDASQYLVFDQIEKRDTHLYECLSEAGFMAFLPPMGFLGQDEALKITFRPIQGR